ncbi:response regulator transcription factor [Marinimicrobium alkaliphilum]|uniref:response regulator transcription factor n=1 Tax=Marinimicrobium alkaliphilum TaxID=2202654 RepID=UPI000DB9D993|nr:response regulator [Marinimicrobium alkaliphilum]
MTRILLIDDDIALASVLTRALARRGYEVASAHNTDDALGQVNAGRFDWALLDLKLGEESGLVLLRQLRACAPNLKVVILTGYSSIATAVDAVKLGAHNYLCKPADVSAILDAFEAPERREPADIPEQPPSVDRLEWEHIQQVLKTHDGNVSATARSLGMHRRTLQRKLQKRPVQR